MWICWRSSSSSSRLQLKDLTFLFSLRFVATFNYSESGFLIETTTIIENTKSIKNHLKRLFPFLSFPLLAIFFSSSNNRTNEKLYATFN